MTDEGKAQLERAASLAESLALRLAAVGAALAGDKALDQERQDAEKIGRRIRQVLREKTD